VGTAEMLEELHASHADAPFERTLQRYIKPQVLINRRIWLRAF
jgi:hypothetical protein